MSEHTLTITEANFTDTVLESDKPVLIDFWAEWCGPCKMIAPILDEIAQDYKDKLVIGKVNVDNDSGLAAKHGVRGIPTLVLIKGGNVEATKVGALTKSQLASFLDEHLGE